MIYFIKEKMKNGFDISRITGDGYLIIPISMSRMANSQSPKEIYKIFEYFIKKIESFGNDVILLYTNGLYFNTEKINNKYREETNQQIIDHSYKLRKLIEKNKEYIPSAFHFLPIDYVILNSSSYREYFSKLKKHEKINKKFQECIKKDIGNREYNEATINFILEEVVVSHIIKQRKIEFPRTLVRNDIWRLIVYPGKYMETELYVWKNNLLPNSDKTNPFVSSHYNFDEKKNYVFDEL